MRSVALVTGGKLKPILPGQSSLIHAMLGFGPVLRSDIFWPLGRGAEAEAALDRALEISPNDEFVIALKAELYQQEGRLDEAAKELARIPKDSTDKTVLIHRVDQALFERNFDEAIFWAKQGNKLSQSRTSAQHPGHLCSRAAGILSAVGRAEMKKRASRSSVLFRKLRLADVLRTPPTSRSEALPCRCVRGTRRQIQCARAGEARRCRVRE